MIIKFGRDKGENEKIQTKGERRTKAWYNGWSSTVLCGLNKWQVMSK